MKSAGIEGAHEGLAAKASWEALAVLLASE